MGRKGILEDKKGNAMVVSIILLIGGIVMYFIVLTTLGPALSAIVHVTEDFKESNPSVNMDTWYNTMYGNLKWIPASTFMILTALVVYVFVNAIRKQWETQYFK